MTDKTLEDAKAQLKDAGVPSDKITELSNLIKEQFCTTLSEYNITLEDEQAIPIIQRVFFSRLYDISQLSEYDLEDEVNQYISRFKSSEGGSDIIFLSGLVVGENLEDTPSCFAKLGRAVEAENYSNSH